MIGVTMKRIKPAITSIMVEKVSPSDPSGRLNSILLDYG